MDELERDIFHIRAPHVVRHIVPDYENFDNPPSAAAASRRCSGVVSSDTNRMTAMACSFDWKPSCFHCVLTSFGMSMDSYPISDAWLERLSLFAADVVCWGKWLVGSFAEDACGDSGGLALLLSLLRCCLPSSPGGSAGADADRDDLWESIENPAPEPTEIKAGAETESSECVGTETTSPVCTTENRLGDGSRCTLSSRPS
mmetsp:Transcript_977/g.2825  ORF Transcript_977/g.2825 Transcript_977/m.2825 type:complete len:201 (-) Transcript_977:217-819(-)